MTEPKRQRGRAKLPDDLRRMHAVRVSLREDELAALLDAATKEGEALPVYVRRAALDKAAEQKVLNKE